MDSRLVALQKAPDDFALLSLPPSYALTEQQIQSAGESVAATLNSLAADADLTTQAAIDVIRQRLAQATQTLSDPLERADSLLKVFDAAKGIDTVPADFLEALGRMQEELSSAVAARDDVRLIRVREQLVQERQRHLNRVIELFSFPRNMPNAAAQQARDMVTRVEINAVRRVDLVLKEL